MLAYRTFFRVTDEPHLIDLVDQQLYSWLKHKRYDADAVRPNTITDLTDDAQAILLRDEPRDGSRSVRARIIETNSGITWTTHLTAYLDRDRSAGWVWVDLDQSADSRFAHTPRLVRDLLDALPARNGSQLITNAPEVVDVRRVDEVVDSLRDAGRQALIFVAGIDPQTDFDRWRQLVASLLRETAGVSTAWVLDPLATRRFNEIVGSSHAVDPGTIRTFAPGVVFGDEADALRHRILSTERIVRSRDAPLRRLLGARARAVVLSNALPSAALRLDRRFRNQLDELLLAPTVVEPTPARPTAEPAVSERTVAEPEVIEPEVQEPEVPEPAVEPGVHEPAASEPVVFGVDRSVLGALGDGLQRLFGSAEVSARSVGRLLDLARTRLTRDRADERIRERIHELQDGIDAARAEVTSLRSEHEDLQIDHSISEQERQKAEAALRYTRGLLESTPQASEMWTVPERNARDEYPDDFVELLVRIEELDHVVFTGDDGPALDLDEHSSLGEWAGKAWEALLALDDYAGLRRADQAVGDVNTYLANTPPTCRGYSLNRHAYTESESVQNMPTLRQARMLPVPATVAPTGVIFMGAHFKLAQSKRISPRLHYYNDVAKTGKVYVGYIGRHLPLAS